MIAKMKQLAQNRRDQPHKYRWIGLFFLLLASFMELLDITIVNIAIPSLQKDLGINYAEVQWVVAAYGLAFAVLLITGGRLGDIFGRKTMFMIGVAGFTLASVLCGISNGPQVLIAARAIQGLFAALMVPQVLSIIHVEFPLNERGPVFGMFGAVSGMASVLGPILGAILIDWNAFNLEWRPIFLVNVPVGSIALIGAALFIHNSKSENPLKLDLPGVGMVSLALLLLIFPLMQGRDLDWPWWTFAMMAASVPLFGLFYLYQRRKEQSDGSPLLVTELFKSRAFTGGLILSLVFFAGMSSYFFIYTLYLQLGLGYEVLHAGLTGIPFSIGVAVAAGGLATSLVKRFGRVVLQVGAALMVLAMVGLSWLGNTYGQDVTSWHMAPVLLVAGLGMGLVIAPVFNFALATVPHRQAGSATGTLETIQQLGGSIGIAIIGVVFFGFINSNAPTAARQVEPQIRQALTAAHLPAQAQDAIVDGFVTCYTDTARQKDTAALPASCQAFTQSSQAQDPAMVQLGQQLQQLALKANNYNFASAFDHALILQVIAYTLTILAVFLLPKQPLTEEQAANLH